MSNREYELKFTVSPHDIATVMAHAAFAGLGGERPTARLNATYFDTPDQALWCRGISLRIRDENGSRTQTVKRASTSGLDRGEWETAATDDVPSLDWLASTPVRRAFRHEVGKELAPSFSVDLERTTVDVRHGAAVIEAALDRGEIHAGARNLPVCELELELKSGEPDALFALARVLITDLPLTPSLISKAERGYRLLDGSWGHPVKQTAPRIEPDMSCAAAFRLIAESCLHDMMLNIEAFRADDDIETVHKSRVALRRLRAAVALFKPMLVDETFQRLRGELKWMSDLLGSARDLDVFQTEVFDPAAKDDGVPGGQELANHMRAKQQQGHAALAAGIASQRWRSALTDLIAWLQEGEWARHEDASEALDAFASARLKKRRKNIVVQGAGLAELSPIERHQLRIEAKKLRYGLEFFEHTAGIGKGSKRYRRLQGGLELLQASLGALHDDEAKQELLRSETFTYDGVAEAADERATLAAGLLADTAPDVDGLMARAAHGYRKVKNNNPF